MDHIILCYNILLLQKENVEYPDIILSFKSHSGFTWTLIFPKCVFLYKDSYLTNSNYCFYMFFYY